RPSTCHVVDPATVPKAVSKERPASKKSAVYAVRFFPAGDYAWLPPKELTRLTTAQINSFVSDEGARRKGGDLMEGYRKALDPAAWEEEYAANPPPAKKSKSKSKAKKRDDEEEDELDAEDAPDAEEADAEDEEEKAAPKKRKRASEPAPAKEKAKPKAKAATKGKKGGKKSKATVESEEEDEAGEAADEEESEKRASKKAKVVDESTAKYDSDPEALKVREWRHKLQKTFLSSNKSVPKAEEMPTIDTLFTTIESYENMNIGYLTFSKIGKVMRHIHLLAAADVPRDEEYKFRDRAKALVDSWHTILNANKAGEGEGAGSVTEGTARMDLNGNGDGDLTVMDVTMDEA
ncbi:hypothetical protein C8F04DRAFT_109581, partial [Mycena alexandri]